MNFQFVLSLVNLSTLLTFVSFVQTLGFVTCGTVIRNTFPTFFAPDFLVFISVSLYCLGMMLATLVCQDCNDDKISDCKSLLLLEWNNFSALCQQRICISHIQTWKPTTLGAVVTQPTHIGVAAGPSGAFMLMFLLRRWERGGPRLTGESCSKQWELYIFTARQHLDRW